MKKISAVFMFAAVLLIAGCSNSKESYTDIDPDIAIEEVEKQAASCTLEDAERMVNSYDMAIAMRRQRLNKLKGDLYKVEVKQITGDNAKEVLAQQAEATEELASLEKAQKVYMAAIDAKKAPAAE